MASLQCLPGDPSILPLKDKDSQEYFFSSDSDEMATSDKADAIKDKDKLDCRPRGRVGV